MDLNDKKHPMTQQMEGYVLRFSTVASVQHATFPKFNIEPQNRFCWQVRNDPKFPGFPSFWTIGGGNLGHTTVKVSRCCAGWIWIIACRMVECTSRPIFWESRFFLRPPEGGQATVWSWGRFPFRTSPPLFFRGDNQLEPFIEDVFQEFENPKWMYWPYKTNITVWLVILATIRMRKKRGMLVVFGRVLEERTCPKGELLWFEGSFPFPKHLVWYPFIDL